MTHRGELSLSIIIWRIVGGVASFLLPWGPKITLASLTVTYAHILIETLIYLKVNLTPRIIYVKVIIFLYLLSFPLFGSDKDLASWYGVYISQL